MRRRAVLVMFLAGLGSLGAVAPAHATFPGRNGKIAIERFVEGHFDLHTVYPDGSGEELVAQDAGGAAWSPDGRELAFIRSTGGSFTRDLIVASEDGSHEQLVATDASGGAWSPDGKRLAFIRRSTVGYALAVVNADGFGLADVTSPSSYAPTSAGWSPDGRVLVFAAASDIHTINANGTDEKNLTHGSDLEFRPAWSPTGDRIAFDSAPLSENSPRFDIYVMNPDGGERTRLTHDLFDSAPTWSPDGAELAFTNDFTGRDAPPYVVLMNVDQALQTRVIDGARDPVWSPDGTKIAFPSGETQSIDTVNTDGSGRTQLTQGSGIFDWQPIPFKNRAKKCKAEGKSGRDFGKCVNAKG